MEESKICVATQTEAYRKEEGLPVWKLLVQLSAKPGEIGIVMKFVGKDLCVQVQTGTGPIIDYSRACN